MTHRAGWTAKAMLWPLFSSSVTFVVVCAVLIARNGLRNSPPLAESILALVLYFVIVVAVSTTLLGGVAVAVGAVFRALLQPVPPDCSTTTRVACMAATSAIAEGALVLGFLVLVLTYPPSWSRAVPLYWPYAVAVAVVAALACFCSYGRQVFIESER